MASSVSIGINTKPASVSVGTNTESEEIEVTFEDQKKINKFACQNARLEEAKEELKEKEKELQSLEDAETELILAEGNTERIPYKMGDVFFMVTPEEGTKLLLEKKEDVTNEIDLLKAKLEEIKDVMSKLRVDLYAKFGSNINLEPQ